MDQKHNRISTENTTHLKEELNRAILSDPRVRIHKEVDPALKRDCDMKAAIACQLLRGQLAQQEMDRRFREQHKIYVGQSGKDVPFYFSTKEQYRKFTNDLQKRVTSL